MSSPETSGEISCVSALLRYNSAVETPAEQPQPAQLPRLSAASVTSAGSHAAIVAAAAGPLAAQPTVATTLFEMSGNTCLSELLQSSIYIELAQEVQ